LFFVESQCSYFVFVDVGVSLGLVILITVACRPFTRQRPRNKQLHNIVFSVLLMAFNRFLLLLRLLDVCVVCIISNLCPYE
jgi:hypothetical protein